jgi:microsomal dipeptidase-like Zn-dependent dipeptidase
LDRKGRKGLVWTRQNRIGKGSRGQVRVGKEGKELVWTGQNRIGRDRIKEWVRFEM